MSGREVISVFQGMGFEIVTQKGSHVKLRRSGDDGSRQTLTVPNHLEIDTGTMRAIIRQASRFVPQSDLVREYYAE